MEIVGEFNQIIVKQYGNIISIDYESLLFALYLQNNLEYIRYRNEILNIIVQNDIQIFIKFS